MTVGGGSLRGTNFITKRSSFQGRDLENSTKIVEKSRFFWSFFRVFLKTKLHIPVHRAALFTFQNSHFGLFRKTRKGTIS
jgi:hypothetical protein